MATIDPTTAIGKVRLRTGDWRDLQLLSDAVVQSALTECENNIPRASALCAQYILGLLSARTHRKLAQIETWGNEQFEQYVQFLQMTILNPNLMTISPIPYSPGTDTDHPLLAFVADWNSTYCQS